MPKNNMTLREESKSFLKKYAQYLPDTIYYEDWKNRSMAPNFPTIRTIEALFKNADKESLRIAEIGIGMGATTLHIAKFLENKGELHIFDFNETVVPIKKMLEKEGFSNIHIHGSSYQKLDSYNWNLLFLLKNMEEPMFDYVFLDGAHSFPVDGLAFFLIDMLLKKGGYIDFDDYTWTHADHIINTAGEYSDEETDETETSAKGNDSEPTAGDERGTRRRQTRSNSGVTIQLPTMASFSVQTTVSVPDGGTILLGGVKRLSEGRQENGVPMLNKIPYINRLFMNTAIGRSTQSIMMMVTPRIIIQEEEEEYLTGIRPTP